MADVWSNSYFDDFSGDLSKWSFLRDNPNDPPYIVGGNLMFPEAPYSGAFGPGLWEMAGSTVYLNILDWGDKLNFGPLTFDSVNGLRSAYDPSTLIRAAQDAPNLLRIEFTNTSIYISQSGDNGSTWNQIYAGNVSPTFQAATGMNNPCEWEIDTAGAPVVGSFNVDPAGAVVNRSKYCENVDVTQMLGQVGEEIPRWIGDSYDDAIHLASEEIDMMVGRVYSLPLVLKPGSTDQLLIKKICRFITTGRVLMAASSAQETNQVHKYASYLLIQAQNALDAIVAGKLKLNDQTPAENTEQDYDSGPTIFLSDEDSFIRGFYGYGESEFDVPSPGRS